MLSYKFCTNFKSTCLHNTDKQLLLIFEATQKLHKIQRKTSVLESLFKCCRIKTCNFTNKRLHNKCFPTNIAQILRTLTGIEIAVGHQTLSNKKCCMSSTHVSKPDNVLYSIIEYHMRKILYVNTCLAHHIAYYKSIIKSLYTFIQQTIK